MLVYDMMITVGVYIGYILMILNVLDMRSLN